MADRADGQATPVLAETRAFLLQQAVEEEKKTIASAPAGDPSGPRQEFSGSANQSIIASLVTLQAGPVYRQLEERLLPFWNSEERNPIGVFRAVLASRSVACVSILFGNLTGVRGVAPLFAILEQAASDRLQYFSFCLATPTTLPARPDQTLWYSYPAAIDTALRSSDFSVFSKVNWFELGSHIRQLLSLIHI